MTDPGVARLLVEEAGRINRPAFVLDDPVQFPRRFDDPRDIEISALLTATISWGRRPMILRDAGRLHALMDHQPYRYMAEGGFEDLDPSLNIHRTFFARNLQWYLRGLREVYRRHGTLGGFLRNSGAAASEAPAWDFAARLGQVMAEANAGMHDSRCLPANLKTTALKRFNMALRWLVRDDGIVDIGIWSEILPKSKLYIPLDVHVGNTARSLGLLDRRANDRRAAEQITAAARSILPEDPALLDFALFGIGINRNVEF